MKNRVQAEGRLQPDRTSLLGLRRVEFLEGLTVADLERLAASLSWRSVHAGEQVISRDATDAGVYLIVGGRVQVTAFSAGGRQITYREIGTGGMFGELAAIDGRARSADVTALEESLLASMTPAIFRALLSGHEVLFDRALKRLSASVREMSDRVFDLSTLAVRNRVHAELLRLARLGSVSGNEARIDPAPRHSELASRLSTYREQVTREISLLSAQGVIAREAHCLVVRDLARLERLVAEVSGAQ